MHIDIDQPREIAVEKLKKSIPKELWDTNEQFIAQLKNKIKNHPLANNPMIELLTNGHFNHQAVKNIHLEYRHAIVQIFTDALLMAQYQARQLEPRLPAGNKMIARFLLTLNVLDEFGFQPGTSTINYYQGNPAYAHYPLFEKVLNELNISIAERENYKPSQIAVEVRRYLEKSYDTYIAVVALLAVAEQQVILYSPPLRQATKSVGLNVEHGYYYVHGVSSDHTALAADDDHEDDLWFTLIQACTPDIYPSLEAMCMHYCDLWNRFWLYQYEANSHLKR